MDPDPALSRRRLARSLSVVLTVLLAFLGPVLGRPAEPASATTDDEAAFVEALNRVRAEQGLAPLTVNAELADLARAHATRMADAGEIFHAERISAGYDGPWSKLGENVGVGAGVDVLVDAFVASPGHFANIVDPAFTEIGVGVVWRDTALYTTHRFLQVPTPTPPPITAPVTIAPVTPTPSPTSAPPTIPPFPDPPTTSTDPSIAPAGPAIRAERVVALLALLEELGT